MSDLNIKVTKTLYFNTFRCVVTTQDHHMLATLRVIPGLPLDRTELPENAPEANPYLLTIVEDAEVNKDTLLDFEERISRALIKRLKTDDFIPQHCQFFYPSPSCLFDEVDIAIN